MAYPRRCSRHLARRGHVAYAARMMPEFWLRRCPSMLYLGNYDGLSSPAGNGHPCTSLHAAVIATTYRPVSVPLVTSMVRVSAPAAGHVAVPPLSIATVFQFDNDFVSPSIATAVTVFVASGCQRVCHDGLVERRSQVFAPILACKACVIDRQDENSGSLVTVALNPVTVVSNPVLVTCTSGITGTRLVISKTLNGTIKGLAVAV